MLINITNSIRWHKILPRITQKQNTPILFLATRVPGWPIKIAFLLGLQVLTSGSSLLSSLVVGVGIMQHAVTHYRWQKERKKLWILRNGDGGDMLHDQRQRQLLRTCPIIFRRYDTSLTSKSRRRWPGNPNGRSQLTLCRQLHSWRRQWLTTASRNRSKGTLLTSNTSSAMTKQP